MSFTDKVVKIHKKKTKGDGINEISLQPFNELKETYSFKTFIFSDCYIYCKIFYSWFTDNNKDIINAKGNIISRELSPEKFNDGKDKIIPNHLPTFLPSFDYENHCKEAIYDLTDDEKLFLWEINGHLSNVLGLRIQELYKTTKIHLTTSNNVDKKNTYDRLGYYTKSTTPEVWLIMDLITGEAMRTGEEVNGIIAHHAVNGRIILEDTNAQIESNTADTTSKLSSSPSCPIA